MSARVQLSRLARLRANQRGGALVEFAVATLVLVPVVLYGMWFSDALHIATVATEASIEPAFDATAYKTHDYDGKGSAEAEFAGVASKVQKQVTQELSTSYDSFDPGASPIGASVVAHPQNLKIECGRTGGSGDLQGLGAIKTRSNLMSTKSWVTCRSSIEINTVKVPDKFMQDHADTDLFPSGKQTFKICGAGPTVTGCGTKQTDGFSILLDDWGLEDGKANNLSIGGSGGNPGYFNVGNDFYVNAGNAPILAAMGAVTNIPEDLGSTGNFRLSYRVDGNGSYNATETDHGQTGPLGGPGSPHTGGPWHDEHSTHTDLDSNAFSTRTNAHYLARSDWPAD